MSTELNNEESLKESLIQSPCIRNCCLNDSDICVGCFRHIDEILQWGSASEQRKKEILIQVKNRTS